MGRVRGTGVGGGGKRALTGAQSFAKKAGETFLDETDVLEQLIENTGVKRKSKEGDRFGKGKDDDS